MRLFAIVATEAADYRHIKVSMKCCPSATWLTKGNPYHSCKRFAELLEVLLGGLSLGY
jgi:hypothetical protein